MYNVEDNVQVTFDDIATVCNHADDNSYMFVGNQLRRYHLGVPQGDPLSAAKASSLCLDAELDADASRELTHGDSDRNQSVCFMDDLFFRIAYSEKVGDPW